MKVHVRTDTRRLVHRLTITDAAQANITQLPNLLHGQETALCGDKAYYKADHTLHGGRSGGTYRVNKSGKHTATWDRINAARSRVGRAMHTSFASCSANGASPRFRYRGLLKNTTACWTPSRLLTVPGASPILPAGHAVSARATPTGSRAR